MSESEPELGLGIIMSAESGRVEILFPAANEQRRYALKSGPLRRVLFQAGDRLKLHDGTEFTVASVEEREGLLVYRSETREVPEAELSDTISFSKPDERLLAGQVDDLHTHQLRIEALRRRAEIQQSPVRGFVGARIDLIPHQLSIAAEVASRVKPRVLLADEVGLGKTIEAGLILHRLHLTGRADRVLLLLPEPLIHQWFVELLRRFNLLFSIFDEARCESIQLHDPAANPFLDSQLVLCSVAYLAGSEERTQQATAAGWDLLIVDEAHHLQWSRERFSPEYALVEQLAAATPGLLLLTATPQQLGPEGHFARLRLLDPQRYPDLDQFLSEAEHYDKVAAAVDRLIANESLSAEDQTLFAAHSPRIRRHSEMLAGGDEKARSRLVADLLDSFGTGRVMFRNTRRALKGFPKREATLHELGKQSEEVRAKVKWLAGMLKAQRTEKMLLICRTRELAEQIHEQLQREMNVSCAVFHEGLTLLQRDRNAAFFAEEEGARILICSEIGSEGRNFQFAHHLILFDLPRDPELLEQRIGRLDRIGQTSTIHIHVPYLPGTEGEVLAQWYHAGLNAFQESLHGASEIAASLTSELESALATHGPKQLAKLVKRSQAERERVEDTLARGHDRLLELNSSRPAVAEQIAQQMRAADADAAFEEFTIRLLDHFGVAVEDLGSRTYLFRPGHLLTDAFPTLPPEGVSVTFDRARAITRDDIGFVSMDHPLIRSALDLLLGSEAGNAAFGMWSGRGSEGIFLEVHGVVECVAPAALHVDRFLPPTPVRIAVDHSGNDHSSDAELAAPQVEKGDVFRLLDRGSVKKKLLPLMMEKSVALATERMKAIVSVAREVMTNRLQQEVERLEDLRELNSHVGEDEITAAKEQITALSEAVQSARLRIDAVRLIFATS